MISGISTSNSHMHIADVHKTGLMRLEVDIITFKNIRATNGDCHHLTGTGWYWMTLFVLPLVANLNQSPWETIKNTWQWAQICYHQRPVSWRQPCRSELATFPSGPRLQVLEISSCFHNIHATVGNYLALVTCLANTLSQSMPKSLKVYFQC